MGSVNKEMRDAIRLAAGVAALFLVPALWLVAARVLGLPVCGGWGIFLVQIPGVIAAWVAFLWVPNRAELWLDLEFARRWMAKPAMSWFALALIAFLGWRGLAYLRSSECFWAWWSPEGV